jgi:tetratricopeptide (TPR) repeat protein
MKRLHLLLAGMVIFAPILLMSIVSLSPVALKILEANRVLQSSTIERNEDESLSLQLLLDYEPWRGDLWERLGRVRLDNGKYSESIDAFKKSRILGGLSGDGEIWLADALISNENHTEAKDLLRLVSAKQKELFKLWQIVTLQRRIGDVYGAEATLLSAHFLYPNDEEISFLLGLMVSTTQPDSAVRFLSRPRALSYNEVLLRDALITTIESTGETLTPSDRFRQIGQVLSSFYQWDVAAQAFNSAVATDPENALNWILLAEAQQQLDVSAFDSVTKALELDPKNEIVNGLSGLYYRRQGKYDLALIYLQRATEIDPSKSVWIIEIGNTYQEMGNLEFAYEHFINAINLTPDDWATWKALAVFCFTFNYEIQETGLLAARKALSLNPGSPVLTDLLGTGLMLSGDYDSAERFLLEAEKLDPNQSAILIHLGQLKVLQKDYESAREYLRAAKEFAPSNRLRELASQLLREISGK